MDEVDAWMALTPKYLAETKYWEKNTDKIRALFDVLSINREWVFRRIALLREIYDAVHYLGLDSYWWDWCVAHFPGQASKVIWLRAHSDPPWFEDMVALGEDFFKEEAVDDQTSSTG